MTSAADVVAVEKAPRRFPPPCWTQEETLALIDAYRERWYALRRGYLRTADWDSVAAAVTSRCPGSSPAKTSAQCRHKMEKLRQRYRAEKQRTLSYPLRDGGYLSSWFFYENMEAMENGTAAPTSVQKPETSAEGSRLKSLLDQNILKLKLKASERAASCPDLGFDGFVRAAKRFNSAACVAGEQPPYLDIKIVDEDAEDATQDEDSMNLGRRKQPVNGITQPPLKSKARKSGNMFKNLDQSGGLHPEMLAFGLRIKKTGKFDQIMDPEINRTNPSQESWVNVSNNNIDNFYCYPSLGASLNPSAGYRGTTRGLKRGRDAFEEIVTSIKLLGEGFVKMERAKMELAREMEAMRREMEMKRNEMLLESQKQIVDAFLKGLFELKNSKKVKTDSA